MNQKLILFDIDGTLIYHAESHNWEDQYAHGMSVAFGITKRHTYTSYNGSVERHMAWDIVKKHGISREEFFEKFPAYIAAMEDYLREVSKKGPLFLPNSDAFALVKRLSARDKYILGLLTGNAKRTADWKMFHTGYSGYFSFGLYGEEADDRVSLAKLVFEKAERELHQSFEPQDVVIIGDTIHDIRCGKAIGAYTIAVTTGVPGEGAVLREEHPDILVDSLIDRRVLSLFSLK